MARFPFSTWIYNPITDFTPDELILWAEAGLTVPFAPRTYIDKHEPELLIPYLDKAHELGMQLIINYEDFTFQYMKRDGEEKYAENFRKVYECLKGHPALFGFFTGDEPNNRVEFEMCDKCYKVQKSIAPELSPYVNLIGGMAFKTPSQLLDMTLEEWFERIKKLGVDFVSQDAYYPMLDDYSVKDYLIQMKIIIEAAEKAGVDVWTNMLCSAHDVFHAPNEAEVNWQINVAAALGCRGGMWFRFYDRPVGFDYFGSPIDEFGNKTELYYHILRAQRRFRANYGELFMSLKRKSTYMTGYKERNVYPQPSPADHDLVTVRGYEEGVISYFEDEAGKEYICIANSSLEFRASWELVFDPEKCRVAEVYANGNEWRYLYTEKDKSSSEVVMHVGQMRLFRIDRK
ncbi:MAG: hypothetical protein IKM46_00995 [Clostridia bacterium]|nr:hypothetical protein [Clostridia bacterium]